MFVLSCAINGFVLIFCLCLVVLVKELCSFLSQNYEVLIVIFWRYKFNFFAYVQPRFNRRTNYERVLRLSWRCTLQSTVLEARRRVVTLSVGVTESDVM